MSDVWGRLAEWMSADGGREVVLRRNDYGSFSCKLVTGSETCGTDASLPIAVDAALRMETEHR